MANLFHKLWVKAEQESVSLFYGYFGKVMGLLLMTHSGHFFMDTAGLPSKVSVWGCRRLLNTGGRPLDGPCRPMEEVEPCSIHVPVPRGQGRHKGLQGVSSWPEGERG